MPCDQRMRQCCVSMQWHEQVQQAPSFWLLARIARCAGAMKLTDTANACRIRPSANLHSKARNMHMCNSKAVHAPWQLCMLAASLQNGMARAGCTKRISRFNNRRSTFEPKASARNGCVQPARAKIAVGLHRADAANRGSRAHNSERKPACVTHPWNHQDRMVARRQGT